MNEELKLRLENVRKELIMKIRTNENIEIAYSNFKIIIKIVKNNRIMSIKFDVEQINEMTKEQIVYEVKECYERLMNNE